MPALCFGPQTKVLHSSLSQFQCLPSTHRTCWHFAWNFGAFGFEVQGMKGENIHNLICRQFHDLLVWYMIGLMDIQKPLWRSCLSVTVNINLLWGGQKRTNTHEFFSQSQYRDLHHSPTSQNADKNLLFSFSFTTNIRIGAQLKHTHTVVLNSLFN